MVRVVNSYSSRSSNHSEADGSATPRAARSRTPRGRRSSLDSTPAAAEEPSGEENESTKNRRRPTNRSIKEPMSPDRGESPLHSVVPKDATPPRSMAALRDKKPIEVKVNVQLFRLRKVDNSAEEIQLDMGLTFIWHDPHLKELCGGAVPLLSTHPSIARQRPHVGVMEPQLWPDHLEVGRGLFDPAWKLDGCSEMNIIKSVSSVQDREKSIVHCYVHLVATIHHNLDLKSFPFDATKLRLRMLSEHTIESMGFAPCDDRETMVFNSLSTEWRIVGPIVIEPEANGTIAASRRAYASVFFNFTIVRRPEWYFYNIFLTSFLVVLASLAVFMIPEDDLADRLGLLFTTWLLLVSMKFVLADRLPLMSYLTTLDKYLVGSYLVMALLVLHVCVRAKVRTAVGEKVTIRGDSLIVRHSNINYTSAWPPSLQLLVHRFHETSDEYFFVYYAAVWIFGHVLMFLYYMWFRSKYLA